MRIKTPILVLMLSLAMLMTLPGTYTNVRAVNQNGPLRWSPFGPQENQLIVSYYSDFSTMFNAFTAGQIDITDWPVQPANLGTGGFCDNAANPDFFCTTPVSQFGIFHLDINSHPALMGKALTTPRTTPTATAVAGTSTTACSAGFGSLTITLQNQEAGNALILDTLNTLTAANQPSSSPSVTVSDSGGATPNGVYNVPCILAGTYKLSSNIYGGSVSTVSIGSNVNTPITLGLHWNSQSNVFQSAARTLWGAALGHMISKSAWVTDFFKGAAGPVDTFGAPSLKNDLTQTQLNQYTCSPLGTNLHSWSTACTTGNVASLDNLVADSQTSSLWWATSGKAVNVNLGYPGPEDLRAACDDLVAMGFTTSGGDCSAVSAASSGPACTTAPCTYAHVVPSGNIVYYIRTNLGRKFWGTVIADTLDFLFGTPSSAGGGTVCYGACPQITPKYYTITQVTPIVFHDGVGSSQDGWQLYTGGYSLSATPDFIYALLTSSFDGSICGAGASTIAPGNYRFYCDPALDTYATAGEFSLSGSGALFTRADQYSAQHGAVVPIEVDIASFVELNGWNFQPSTQSSIVNTLGFGSQAGYWSLLNARQLPGYSPSNPIYAPGGRTSASDNGLIRRGFSQDTDNVSPFQAGTVWDAEVYSYVFDSMLALNPNTGGSNAQLVDWQTTSHSSSFNPTETTCNSINGCVTGTTTQIWHLRNDIKFQDGNSQTANDVAYSIIAYRDVPSVGFQSSVAAVTSAVGLDCGTGQPCKTLQVKVQGQSPFWELDIGGVPIIEKSLWAPFCGDPPSPTSQCANVNFDPMAQGIFVGSGPYQCVVPAGFANAGHVGGSCTENADGSLGGQALTTGARILFTKYPGYIRCCTNDLTTGATSSLYKLSWADSTNKGVVNILDLASAAVHFGQPDAYWVNPKIAAGSTVNIQDLATVAFYFGHGTIYPYTLPSGSNPLVGVDPQIDPYFCPATGC